MTRTVLTWTGFVLGPPVLNGLLLVGWDGVQYVLPALAMLVLLFALRRAPMTALVLMFVNIGLVTTIEGPRWDAGFYTDVRIMQLVAVNIAVGHLAAVRRPRVSAVTAVVVLAAEIALAAAFHPEAGDGAGFDLGDEATRDALVVIVAWTAGNVFRQRRRDAAAKRAEAEAEAIHEERLRIARELHDMVAHGVGVIAIQAGMGRRIIDTQPDEARAALGAIEDTSRQTLAALRRMVGTLRRADGAAVPSPLGPAPGLAELDSIVERSLDAGVKVEIRRRGEEGPLPPDIDLSAFRIIQEAVTNVVRHAATPHCAVLVDRRAGELFIEVTDDGRGSFAGIGYGIAGMRERAVLLDGELSAGPRHEGGFRVAARIPLPPDAR